MINLFDRDHENYELNFDLVTQGFDEDQCLLMLTSTTTAHYGVEESKKQIENDIMEDKSEDKEN